MFKFIKSAIKKFFVSIIGEPNFTKVVKFLRHYIFGLFDRIDNDHVFLLGGGLAFSLFVCIIPFILIIFSVLGNILDSNNLQNQINTFIDTIIPYNQYSDFVKKIVFSRIDEVIEYKTAAGVIGALGLLFAASGLFSSMRTILNKVYKIETEMNFILVKLMDFALVVMVILLFFAVTITMPFLDYLKQAAYDFKYLQFLQAPIFEHFLFSVISFTLILIVFLVLYLAVPLRRQGRKTTLVSGLSAAILWEAAKQVFGYYIYNFASFGKIYGTYALIVVVAIWIYYSSVVFIIGAEIGRLYYEKNFVKVLK